MRRTSSNNGRSKRDQRGSVIVELALMLPLLAIFILGAIDLGLIVREHQVLQNAAREGARFSAQPANHVDATNPSATPESIRDKVIEYLAQEKLTVTASGVCVQPDTAVPRWNCALTNGGNIEIRQEYPVQTIVAETVYDDFGSAVIVTYNRAFLFKGGSLFQFNEVPLIGNSVFRNLY